MEKRVVITGLGVIGPVGNNCKDFWEGIRSGKNGIDVVTKIDVTPHKAKLGGEVKGFEYPDKRAAKRLDLSVQYALTASEEAVKDSGLAAGEFVHVIADAHIYDRHIPLVEELLTRYIEARHWK